MQTPIWDSPAITNAVVSLLTLLGVWLGIKINRIEHNTNSLLDSLRKENEQQRTDAKDLAAVTEANKRAALDKK
jgi:hypothetical protein